VVATGSESTGKTTLVEHLAARFAAPWVPESSRGYVEEHRRPLGPGDVEPIARRHLAAERAAAAGAGRLLLLDTDLVSTVVYARHYYGSCSAWIEAAARELRGDLYLLHHPDVPWVPEPGMHDRGDRREEMHALFAATLRELDATVVDVRGDFPARRATAARAVAWRLGRIEGESAWPSGRGSSSSGADSAASSPPRGSRARRSTSS
jgi:NadR type nicotinamide-nucleotide adenylyltransferase